MKNRLISEGPMLMILPTARIQCCILFEHRQGRILNIALSRINNNKLEEWMILNDPIENKASILQKQIIYIIIITFKI